MGPLDRFRAAPSFTAWPQLKGQPNIKPTAHINAANQISATQGHLYAKHACCLISAGFVWLCLVSFRLVGGEITFRGWADKREVHYLLPSRGPSVVCLLLSLDASWHDIWAQYTIFPSSSKFSLYTPCIFSLSLMPTFSFNFPFVHSKVSIHSALSLSLF